SAGACTLVCQGGTTKCGSACVVVANDPKNCGGCGVVCSDWCNNGQCCGDGKKNLAEQCDKNDLGGNDCVSVLGPGWKGSLACSASCKFDTSGCTPSTIYSDVADPGKWSMFDAATVNGGAKGYQGGVFDGRYVYFVPHHNGMPNYFGLVTRYDTQGSFGDKGAWTTFDTTSVNGGAKGFLGGVFDGRYVYLVPHYNGGYNGIVARYDSQAAFQQQGSWATFDVTAVHNEARGFFGGVFDGRYVYLVPCHNGMPNHNGRVARYDTKGAFDQNGSWATFDVNAVKTGARGFHHGGVFDGRYVYFSPYYNPDLGYNGLVTRYDTQGAFGANGSWSFYDVAAVDAGAKGFHGGAAFDGRYVYFVPYYNGGYDGIVARFDTQGAFDQKGSWATFDVTAVNAGARGLMGAGFDGRYLYFVPYHNGMPGYDGIVARFDTQGAFDQKGSWAAFDVSGVNGAARGFIGGVFDGRYFYLVPYHNGMPGYDGIVARFDTKTPPSMPKGYNGSFF
ncbi:MAG: hypothetical protein HY744_30505, partial [Deltaproteobacteria bacterium]|nr:hypothetical protein [Deltaproteobacteria bacterium]